MMEQIYIAKKGKNNFFVTLEMKLSHVTPEKETVALLHIGRYSGRWGEELLKVPLKSWSSWQMQESIDHRESRLAGWILRDAKPSDVDEKGQRLYRCIFCEQLDLLYCEEGDMTVNGTDGYGFPSKICWDCGDRLREILEDANTAVEPKKFMDVFARMHPMSLEGVLVEIVERAMLIKDGGWWADKEMNIQKIVRNTLRTIRKLSRGARAHR